MTTTVACTNINLLTEAQMPASPSNTELYAVELDSKPATLTGTNTFTGANTFSGTTILAPTTYLAASGGYEGGEIKFKSGDSEVNAGKEMNLDRYDGKFRFFGQDSSGTTKILLQLDVENDSADASSGVKKSIVNWGMPNYSATISGVGNNYTAPKDGYYMFSIANNNSTRTIAINGVSFTNVMNSYGSHGGFEIALRKGDVINISSGASLNYSYFIPVTGE